MEAVQRRIRGLFLGLLLLLVLAAWRAFDLGVVRGPSLQQVANDQHVSQFDVPAMRGSITDRNGVYLAVSEPADLVTADPLLLKPAAARAAAGELAPLLDESPSSVLSALQAHTGYVVLAPALADAQAQRIAKLQIPGIAMSATVARVYPRDTLAAQVIGTVGAAGHGLAGLEYQFDSQLHGVDGERRVVSDAHGQPISIRELRTEKSGENITLTLDANIQQRAEDVLDAVGQIDHPLDATAIVMNPNTGALLAVANWPPVNAADSTEAASAPFDDRSVNFTYEPGSTFKVVTIGGALQEGLVTPQTDFFLQPQIQVANRTIHDAESRPAEWLTTSQILAQSSNVGAITIGLKLGADSFNYWVHRFGFGRPTGVDLPGDEGGIVLTPSQYSGSSMGNLPIGQGESVTPMQIADAYAAIANGGILRSPHIVSSIGGHAVPEPAGHRIISEQTASELRQMLRGVLAPGGTASEVSIPGYVLAGKTGTANKVDPLTHEYSDTEYVASFVGFAPASHPQLLCAVIVDQPSTGDIYGGTVAAPAFGQIMGFALPYLGIAPNGAGG